MFKVFSNNQQIVNIIQREAKEKMNAGCEYNVAKYTRWEKKHTHFDLELSWKKGILMF